MPRHAANITGPACVDGIGPAGDWQGLLAAHRRRPAKDKKLGEWALIAVIPGAKRGPEIHNAGLDSPAPLRDAS